MMGMLGLLTGLIFGFVMQRGRFDMAAGFQAFYTRRDMTQLKSYVLAVIIQAAALYALVRLGIAQMPEQSYYWMAAVMGGMLFGAGMALAGSGAAGIWTRAGQGAVDALVTVTGFAIGAAAARGGMLSAMVRDLHSVSAQIGTLYEMLDVGFGTAVSFAALLAMWWFSLSYRAQCACSPGSKSMLAMENLFPNLPRENLDGRTLLELLLRRPWSWVGTGVTMGIVASLAWLTAAISSARGGLEMTTGTAGILRYITGGGATPAWHLMLVLGVPLGACLAARAAREYRLSNRGPRETLQAMAGGLMMGVGGVICMGDDIASGLTGTAVFSLTGITATAFMFMGAWVANLAMERARGRSLEL
jgi:uncharacterized protein